MTMLCELRTLLFTEQPARAQLLNLRASWQRIIAGHPYPPPVLQTLGELVAASALLSASLKFNGSLILQIKGDGPIRLMVAECSSELGIRATAMFDPQADWAYYPCFRQQVNANGQGRFVMILDPKDRLPGQHPYQGIIALEGDTLASTIENYMLQSEQLQTRLWLGCNADMACGLLLQQMPDDGGHTLQVAPLDAAQAAEALSDPLENWTRLTTLAETLKTEELLAVDTATLARRLFWQEAHNTLTVRHPVFRCTCSREKVGRMLRSLGEAEVNDALAEQGKLEISCDYCNTGYAFDAVDCKALFVGNTDLVPDNHPNGENGAPSGSQLH